MFHSAKCLQIFLSFLAQGALLMLNNPIVAYGRQPGSRISPSATNPGDLNDILQYISAGWDTLTRTMNRCESLQDSKTDGEPVLYLPAEMAVPPSITELQDQCRIRVEHLPARITGAGEIDLGKIRTGGLLYLENPYVEPGGQFNEMYGWDSYFIIRGLLRDHRMDLAKGMVENFFFEINHYGGVLNANRTYY